MLAMVGGAKNCGNFLAAESHGKYPLPSSITHEGTLYEHYFAIPPTKEEALKCDFTTATSPDPISGEIDHFLCLGTSSKYDGAGLRNLGGRPPVKLIFVLDVSGSMSGKFLSKNSKVMRSGIKIDEKKEAGTLLDAAKEALLGLLENLKEGDSFGLVSFCRHAKTELSLEVWQGEKSRLKVTEIVKSIQTRGSTDLTCGFTRALKEFDNDEFRDSETIRRVFFLTDMRMTAGNARHLLSSMRKAAARPLPIHTTIIGFGFELDTNLCATLSAVPFCNFFSVHSASEFLHQMTWEFDYLVFPIIEDLVVSVVDGEGQGVSVEKVCGSPESLDDYPKGTLMGSKGMFASQTQGNDQSETKGGVVLVKLKLENPDKPLRVKTRFKTCEKEFVEFENEVVFPKWDEIKTSAQAPDVDGGLGVFEGEAARKGVLLCRYVEFMKRFLEDVQNGRETPTITKKSGIVWNEQNEERKESTQKAEKTEEPGCLSEYKKRMEEFLGYYKHEASFLDDTGLGTWAAKMEQLLPKEK